MLGAFCLACRDTVEPEQRRALFLSLVVALLVLTALALGFSALLAHFLDFGTPWLDWPLRLLGAFAAHWLAWMLFPVAVTVVLSFQLDAVLARLERRHYPLLPPARPLSVPGLLRSGLALAAMALLLNLAALPFYLWPAINFLVYYAVNGYLLAWGYFELVAARHLDATASRIVWRRHRPRLIAAGVVIAGLLSVPLVNLVAPLVAAAFMLHLVARLEPFGAPGETAAGWRPTYLWLNP